MAIATIGASLLIGRYMQVDHASSKEVDDLSERIIRGRSYAEIYQIRSNLRIGKYELHVYDDDDMAIELIEKDRSSPFIKSH